MLVHCERGAKGLCINYVIFLRGLLDPRPPGFAMTLLSKCHLFEGSFRPPPPGVFDDIIKVKGSFQIKAQFEIKKDFY